MQSYWVYMLRCADGSYYTGHTDNLEARLWQHRQGLAADWTRRRRPVELVWSMVGDSRDDVFAMERRIKTWSVAKKEALIAGDWELVGHYARPPRERPAQPPSDARPSTSLGTSDRNDEGKPLVPSEVEGRSSDSSSNP
jgi:predicted GIY-YIG superfamily endonuclease